MHKTCLIQYIEIVSGRNSKQRKSNISSIVMYARYAGMHVLVLINDVSWTYDHGVGLQVVMVFVP